MVHEMAKLLKPRLQKNTLKFLKSAIDPYSTEAGASFPDKITRKSARFKSFSKGTMSTGNQDFGFVGVYPLAMCYGDATAVTASNSGFLGNTLQTDTGATIGVDGHIANSPLLTTAINPQALAVRIVGCGLRMLNVTPYLDRGGYCVGMYNPDDETFQGSNASSLLNYQSVHYILPKDKWIHAEYAPVKSVQYSFSDVNVGTTNILANCPLALMVNAPASAAQTYVWESYCIFEAIGKIDGVQDVHVDPLGQAAVLEVLGTLDGSASDQWIEHIPEITREVTNALTKISGASVPLLLAMGAAA